MEGLLTVDQPDELLGEPIGGLQQPGQLSRQHLLVTLAVRAVRAAEVEQDPVVLQRIRHDAVVVDPLAQGEPCGPGVEGTPGEVVAGRVEQLLEPAAHPDVEVVHHAW